MKTVRISIGLPSSGKSTYFKKLMAKMNVPHAFLNADMVCEELNGNSLDRSDFENVSRIHKWKYKKLLLSQDVQEILIDNTSLDEEVRSQYYQIPESLGLVIGKDLQFKLYYFDISGEDCKKLQENRDRKVPNDVINQMAKRIYFPNFDETYRFGKAPVVILEKKDILNNILYF